MKTLQKLILPILLILVVFIIYNFYFAKSGLGSFDDFDPNNTAVKEIRVQLIADRGITQQGEDVVFYAADKNGKIMMVNGHVSLPEGFDKAEVIILKGHLSGNSFHTHEVLLD
jgi:cytochrome c-type biogenesis protein CcmE